MTMKNSTTLLNEAIVMPYRGTMDTFEGGVFTSERDFLPDSIVYRGSMPPIETPNERLEGTYIWGGCIFVHFGHFIWETLARLYSLRQCSEKYPIVFISPTSKLDYVKLLFKTLGVKNPLLLLQRPTVLQRLIYSPPASTIVPLGISEQQIKALASFDCQKTEGESVKIWLSRTGLQAWQHIDSNERYIEKELEKNGFTVIHPENIPLRQQTYLLSTADIVAGFDGSAWFSLFFAKQIFCKAFVFNRFEKIVDTVAYLMQCRNIEHKLYEFPVGRRESSEFGKNKYLGSYHLEPRKIIDALCS